MKIVPFPRPGDDGDDEAFVAQLEAALRDESSGDEAESWRELRADVRSLAPPMSGEFERELYALIERQGEERQREPAPRRAPRRLRIRPRAALARVDAWLASGMRARLLAAGGISVMAAIVALALIAPWREVEPVAKKLFKSSSVQVHAGRNSPRIEQSAEQSEASAGAVAAGGEASSSVSAATARASGSSAAATPYAHIQQRGASLTLAPKPGEVQSVADEVAQLAVRDGGFVQSSQVNLRGASGEATLTLSLPSARLSGALAALGRLAPTRAESQSLQDITDEYDADRTKLADAVAERQALLRALAKASTQGQIDSLRARLALAGGAIARARTSFAAVSRRGSNSSVEVSVLGDGHASEARSTLQTALHDAGDVLKVALAVLIVALAVLVPLAILTALGALAWRARRRWLRERALS